MEQGGNEPETGRRMFGEGSCAAVWFLQTRERDGKRKKRRGAVLDYILKRHGTTKQEARAFAWVLIKTTNGGWRDGPAFKNTDCSCRGSRFNSRHPKGSSQLSVISVPGWWLGASNALFWPYKNCMNVLLTHAGKNPPMHTKYK